MRPGVQEGLHTSLKDPQQNPDRDWLLKEIYGSVSKPCTPGEHQNSWKMDVHPIKNGINRY